MMQVRIGSTSVRLTAAALAPLLLSISIVACVSAAPGPHSIATKHILTAAYLRSKDTQASPSTVSPWLSWASTSWQANRQVTAAGIRTMFYIDPNRQQPRDPLYTSDETAFAHTCDGRRIKSRNYEEQYLLDPASGAVLNALKNRIDYISRGAHWDAFFLDDVNSLYALDGTPCNYDPDVWLDASKHQIEALGVPVIYNGLQEKNQ